MILDAHGDPVPIRVERKALGFTDRTLPCGEQETIYLPSAYGGWPEWREDEDHAEPHYRRKR